MITTTRSWRFACSEAIGQIAMLEEPSSALVPDTISSTTAFHGAQEAPIRVIDA